MHYLSIFPRNVCCSFKLKSAMGHSRVKPDGHSLSNPNQLIIEGSWGGRELPEKCLGSLKVFKLGAFQG